jgi:hypothetical protein
VPLSPLAVSLWEKSIPPKSRILVLGGGGWFGQTCLAMSSGLDVQYLLIGQSERMVSIGGKSLPIRTWSAEKILSFEPNVVLDFAFLTKDLIPVVGHDQFIKVNQELSDQLFWVTQLPSVQAILTISSGAATLGSASPSDPHYDPYGGLKREVEESMAAIASAGGVKVQIGRAWSVSGGYVGKPMLYAFSGFIESALKRKQIVVESSSLVFRRYCAVEEFLAICFASMLGGGPQQIDSGGHLIEIGELAHLIAKQVPGTEVYFEVSDRKKQTENRYHSDSEQWNALLKKFELTDLTIGEQIGNVVASISSGNQQTL